MTATRLSCLLAAGALACASATMVGCSGDDTTAPPEDSGVDAVVDSGVDAAKDAGKDSTVADTGTDAAKDSSVDSSGDALADSSSDAAQDASGDAGDGGLAPVGSPCNVPNAIESEACGLCGTHKRACLPGGDGGYVWGGWGFCQGQVVNGCDPNLSYPDSNCGNCGTLKKVCLSNCTFDQSLQCVEPANACKPGSTNFVLGLSCDGGGREQTCSNTCTYGNFGNCQPGPTLPSLNASLTAGNTVHGVFTWPASPTLARLTTSTSATCPISSLSTVTNYSYVVINNPDLVKSVKVAIYHSQASTYIDSTLAVYTGNVPPADNDLTARKACLTGSYVADDCVPSFSGLAPAPSPAACVSSWAGTRDITIPPNGSVTVFSTPYFANAPGDYQLNVYTQSVF